MSAYPHPALTSAPAPLSRQCFIRRLLSVRGHSVHLAKPLSAEDQCIQSMPDTSPAKWHLAHTSWFFETLVLQPHHSAYRVFDPRFAYLFNSYYEALGPRHARAQRGLLTRPSAAEVLAYRLYVDAALQDFAALADDDAWRAALPTLVLGLQHEQQHQELLLTDVLHAFWCNPLLPAYQQIQSPAASHLKLALCPEPLYWLDCPGGQIRIGQDHGLVGDDDSSGFAFDNESPSHHALLQPYQLASRLVSCGDYADFIADGGYRRPALWLSDGWATVQREGWQAPLYWLAPQDARAPSDAWQIFGLNGVQPLDPAAAVLNLSFYEAAAYAEWAGARLPTEFEWEAAAHLPGLHGMTGHAWQWTRSSYDPYPGFKPLAGVAGEYNGKFMVGQLVLRGSSLATPAGHARPSYRNFFPPAARWQFSGIRLARDL